MEDSTIKLIVKVPFPPFNGRNFEYSTDNAATWNSYKLDTEISLKAGENVKFRGDNPSGIANWNNLHNSPGAYHQFVMTGKIAAYGSVISLLSPTLSVPSVNWASFCYLFLNCNSLIKAPELSKNNEISRYCYYGMFRNCTNLVVAPSLQATILSENCYSDMFLGCTSLVESPLLPATELKKDCYSGLFSGCINLRKITCYASVGNLNYCKNWHPNNSEFANKQPGIFVKAKGAQWSIDDSSSADGIPYNWSVVEVDVYKEAPMDGKQYARQNGAWTPVESVEPGISDAPSDGQQYARQNGTWTPVEEGITDAPSDGTQYARQNGAWTVVTEGITDAPSDSKTYGRNNGAWTPVESGYPIKGGVEIDNGVVSVQNYGIYTKLNGNFISYESGNNYVRLYDKLEVMIDGEKSESKFIDVANAGNGVVKTSNGGKVKFWSGTQAEYDAIATKDANTLYIIK